MGCADEHDGVAVERPADDGVAYVQSGGGIVYDSDAAAEYAETENKAMALIRAIGRADIIDNPRGAKIAGSGFPVYKGAGSALQRALISWFLDVHTREHGMTEVWPPAVVKLPTA